MPATAQTHVGIGPADGPTATLTAVTETDDRAWWERLIDERVALAGIALEAILALVDAGVVAHGTVAGIVVVLRQVVTPHHTEVGERRRRQRAGRRHRRQDVLVPHRG